MALVESNHFQIGSIAPIFSLINTIDNTIVSLEQAQGSVGTVIVFICNHCPFVVHINDALIKIANEYKNKGINFVAISSNDIVEYPQDAPELMKKNAIAMKYPFPYLYDETQAVAKEYKAACTPDLYVFDADLKAVYHGQLDNSRPGNGQSVTGQDLKHALDCLVSNKPNTVIQKPSIGCSIKWKE